MKPFMNEHFLLQTRTAQELYHGYAAQLPIIDYHCHLSPQWVAEDHRFRSITELWLGGDHYKWRAMRANGVDERYITGDADDWEKFQKWAETVPQTMRNPLYHWTHLELRTAFGITELLNPTSARRIYEACNERLQSPEFSAQGLMRRYHVECVCTTDDPVDSLEFHQTLQKNGFDIKVLPTWRPDKATMTADSEAFRTYVARLAEVTGCRIETYDDLIAALQLRHDYFAAQGCVLADHGVCAFPYAEGDAAAIYNKVMQGADLSVNEQTAFQTAVLLDLARMNHAKGWVQQFHFGPMRNVNSRMYRTLGPDTGFDTIGDSRSATALARFLDRLDEDNRLTKTILYNLNPSDNTMVAAMVANFQDGSAPGKMQLGAAWWFNDQIDGMERQMNALSQQGLLSRFVGMLTDSRSFLSYPRHEYFRRVLCNLLGNDIENGLLPAEEMPYIIRMVEDICYYNAKRYIGC